MATALTPDTQLRLCRWNLLVQVTPKQKRGAGTLPLSHLHGQQQACGEIVTV